MHSFKPVPSTIASYSSSMITYKHFFARFIKLKLEIEKISDFFLAEIVSRRVDIDKGLFTTFDSKNAKNI
jgi:hypothetical protein